MDTFVEAVAVLSGLLYLYLEIKQKDFMWVVGLVTAVAYTAIYAQEGVYASMSYQIYYILISLYGFFRWKKDKHCKAAEATGSPDPDAAAGNLIVYRHVPWMTLFWSVLIFIGATWFMVEGLSRFTGDPTPLRDASVTVLGAIATYWLSKSYIEQWLIWFIVNIVTIWMFITLGLYLSVALYAVYTFSALYGYRHWLKSGKRLQ